MPSEVIGEVNGVSFNPDDETITLHGEYGNYQFIANEKTRGRILSAFESIEENDDS